MSSGSLSESWLGARTGLDPARLDVLRRRGELLGVRVGARYEYPAWQFGPDGQPLPALAAVLVESADEAIADANDLGVEIDDVVDAPNTYAVFLKGPEHVRIEYVEHKPTFSLS